LDKHSSAGITVLVDPIASVEGVVLGSRSPNLEIGMGCSCASLAASALVASDTSMGEKIRAPTLGSSGRPVGTFNASSPYVSVFIDRAIALLISAFSVGSVQDSPNMMVELKSSAIYFRSLSSNVIPH
jgi:hypothetical protein